MKVFTNVKDRAFSTIPYLPFEFIKADFNVLALMEIFVLNKKPLFSQGLSNLKTTPEHSLCIKWN
jgi:hypothetical protein